MRGQPLLALLLAIPTGSACTAVQPECPRQWFEVRGGVFDVDRDRLDRVDEASGWSLGGGYDLNADIVRVSWEIAASWASHDVDVPPADPGDSDVDLGVVHVSSGLRASTRLRDVPLGVFVDAGGAWHDEESNDSAFRADDQFGWYLGAGLEWWYTPLASLGPAVWHFEGSEGDLSDTWIGLTFRFYGGSVPEPDEHDW